MSEQALIYKVTGGDGTEYHVREAGLKGVLDTEIQELGPGDRLVIDLSDMTEEEYNSLAWDKDY